MIRYDLKCPEGHHFDSWFQSGSAFEELSSAGHVSCPICGQAVTEKALMAPKVSPSRSKADQSAAADSQAGVLAAPGSNLEKALADLRKQVQDNSDYVGDRFAEEARAIHEGEVPARSIYGEATRDQATELARDGVPFAPLPFMNQRKTN